MESINLLANESGGLYQVPNINILFVCNCYCKFPGKNYRQVHRKIENAAGQLQLGVSAYNLVFRVTKIRGYLISENFQWGPEDHTLPNEKRLFKLC